ncbi:hypothetical protein SeMB42_g02901 [Synchytrium endobioticum]|uniref:Fibrous sheath-interacting protein 1 n=1 Tax=Synchytrium endobioticum TaxID=286115 RepID=A0A507DCS1_9FUNG|nr:hypothetical protein SeLEV6574_g06126 [Synchytrium endobioticum]TPX48670.1 hypothetical protein SeMB42_g02901 [Synchytrium endobioticum]
MATPPGTTRSLRQSLIPRSASAASTRTVKSQSSNDAGAKPAQPWHSWSEQTSSATLVHEALPDLDQDADVPISVDIAAELERDQRESLAHTRRMLDELARRDVEWEARLEDSDAHLALLQSAVEGGHAGVVAAHAESASARGGGNDQGPGDGETRTAQILHGLSLIRELDAVLEQKTMLARSVASARACTAGSVPSAASAPAYVPDAGGNDEPCSTVDETESLAGADLRSVTSTSMRQNAGARTFITEPRLRIRRRKIGKTLDSDGQGGDDFEFEMVQGSAAQSAGGHDGQTPRPPTRFRKRIEAKVTSYEPGDFIGRNKALGPDARYFSAMTDEEKARVQAIMAAEVEAEPADEVAEVASVAPAVEQVMPFTEVDSGDIDSQLDKYTTSHRATSAYTSSVASRDLADIMREDIKDIPEIQVNQKKRLEELEQHISRIHEKNSVPASREEIERTLLDCMHIEQSLKDVYR